MVSQAADGALVFGDSHEYGAVLSPFDNPEIDQLVLAYLDTFFQRPDPRIAARWHGVYLKHRTKPWLLSHPDEGVTVVAGVGGAGMTLSFGLAEQVVHEAVTIA
jgi:glycine/D-amino acid oxidase-like deaminating enzyme